MNGDPLIVSESFTIRNLLGLHARAAAAFVKIANRYQSEIFVRKDEAEINGKSIMGVLMLAAAKHTTIKVTAQGADAREALEALGRLIEDKFGEE
jgi:phosphocarrier protein